MSDTYRSRYTDDWIPLPEALVRRLGWPEGTELEIEAIEGMSDGQSTGFCLLVTINPTPRNRPNDPPKLTRAFTQQSPR